MTNSSAEKPWGLYELEPGITYLRVDTFHNFWGTPEWKDVCDWLEAHNIDPHKIPAYSEIYRNEILHRIVYMVYVDDGNGKAKLRPGTLLMETEWRVEQGEAGPLPWPKSIGEAQPVNRIKVLLESSTKVPEMVTT